MTKNQTIHAERVNQTTTNTVAHSFDVADRLGRTIGMTVTFFEFDYVEPTDDYISCYIAEKLGHFFKYTTQTTRNGIAHQASHESGIFDTAAERDAAAEKAVSAAKKRALDPKARTKA